nr:hypothetical protein [Streptomyces lavendulae]
MITAWKSRHRSVSGHQGAYTMRGIVNAILHQGRTGCQRSYLPKDQPPKKRDVLLLRRLAGRRNGPDDSRAPAPSGP